VNICYKEVHANITGNIEAFLLSEHLEEGKFRFIRVKHHKTGLKTGVLHHYPTSSTEIRNRKTQQILNTLVKTKKLNRYFEFVYYPYGKRLTKYCTHGAYCSRIYTVGCHHGSKLKNLSSNTTF